jgi:hypothetical protein
VSARESVNAVAVSAVVELDGGQVAVEHAVSGTLGSDAAPCAPSASPRWYLADGTTTVDAHEALVLFNPFPDDSVVDIRFATERGPSAPAALQGLPLEAGTTKVIELTDSVRRRLIAATTVEARSGRLVVDRVLRFEGTGEGAGIALSLATPTPSTQWYFASGIDGDGRDSQWVVYNPSDQVAQVSIEVVPDSGEPVAPVPVSLPSATVTVIDAGEVLVGVGHWSEVRSENGVPVVVELRRVVTPAAASTRRGWSSMLGSPLATERWVLATGRATATADEVVTVLNPGPEPVIYELARLVDGAAVPVASLGPTTVAPGARSAVLVDAHLEGDQIALVVTADGPVVVERQLEYEGQNGLGTSLGIPVR